MAHQHLGVCCHITVWAWVGSAGSCEASGILFRFRRAPLHVLVNLLYSAFCVAVYRVLLGLSFPPFPPGSVSLLFFGIGVSVRGWLGLGLVLCLIYLLFFH